MQHPYDVLAKQNAGLLASAFILPAQHANALSVARFLLRSRARYAKAADLTSVLIPVTAAIHEREADGDFHCCMANGERIVGTDHKTTLVPRGRGPYSDWESSVEDAFHLDGLDRVAATHRWTQESLCYYTEAYNGFGPRDHGRHSGYVWSGTNVYNGGKYVRDGNWDPHAWDRQLGTVALMLAIAEVAPDLALPRALPNVTAPTVVPPPAPVPDGHGHPDMSAADIQRAMNALGCVPPLLVDGNFGRITSQAIKSFQRFKGLEVDGLVGPATRAALQEALVNAHAKTA